MEILLSARIVPLIIVVGAPIAGWVIALMLKAFKPSLEIKQAWLITTYVLMLVQAVGVYFALP